MANILLIEDDSTFARILEGFLLKQEHQVDIRATIKEAEKSFHSGTYDLLMLDYRLPDGTGLELMKKLKLKESKIPVIIMTSFHDIKTAVKSMRDGAFDYITKPVNPDELLMVLNEALHKKSEPAAIQKTFVEHSYVEGNSTTSRQLHEHIQLVAPTDMSVIILGESGTGKEQAARKIHMQSTRANKPFVAIDCGSLSAELASSELFGHVKGSFTGALHDKKGHFEMANGGTLFLDEIGNLGYEVQVKLLRVLQEKMIQPVGSNKPVKTDVRIITATNDDLLKSVNQGLFREDLYHRVNEFKIKIPSLRERVEDLPEFVSHFIQTSNRELNKHVKGFSEDVMRVFKNYDWPGNLRELRNISKRAVLLAKGDIAGMETLPEEMTATPVSKIETDSTDLKAVQQHNEKELIIKALAQVKNNKAKAARLLNIDRKTLYMKMAKYQIDQL